MNSFLFDLDIYYKIHAFSTFVVQLNNPCFLTGTSAVVRVYKVATIDTVEEPNPYENTSFRSKLIVSSGGVELHWLTLKHSSIADSGLGVFAARDFSRFEFITCYLGVFDPHMTNWTYGCNRINVIHENSGGFEEDYWFGHRIQHGSGKTANVEINSQYMIIAKRRIMVGEELFMDYGRQIFCLKCAKEQDFFPLSRTKKEGAKMCSKCSQLIYKGRQCVCEKTYFCMDCYDKSQF